MLNRLYALMADFIDYNLYISRYDKIVVLTEEDKYNNWRRNDNVIVIPNPLPQNNPRRSALTEKTVVSAGRLVSQKNFKSLLNSWYIVHKAHPEWNLEIWGDGALKQELQSTIGELGLDGSAQLKGYTTDLEKQLCRASIFVCSSSFEGFCMVITEAMSCGLPVVSYSCPCGPKDIISDGDNGYLVGPGDEEGLAGHICKLIEDKELRQHMGDAARHRAQDFRIESIAPKWMHLFNTIAKQ